MGIFSKFSLVGAIALSAALPVAAHAQRVRVAVGLGRSSIVYRSSPGNYSNYDGGLFSGIYITDIQAERLDQVQAYYGNVDPLNDPDELWAMRQVLGPGERIVFDENVANLRGDYGEYNNGPWYGGINARIVFPSRRVIVNRGDRDDRGSSVGRERGGNRGGYQSQSRAPEAAHTPYGGQGHRAPQGRATQSGHSYGGQTHTSGQSQGQGRHH